MNKAFSHLQIKSFDPEQGILKGTATTPTTDRAGDIVEPMGATFALPLPLLFNHDHDQPIGHVIEAAATAAGIEIIAKVAKDATARINEIWQMIKEGLVKGLSIGFRPTEAEPIAGGYRFKKWEWLELSAVTVPANPEASIQLVKTSPEEKTNMTLAEQIRSFEQKKSAALASMDTLITKGVALAGDDETQYQALEAEVQEIDKHLARLKAAEARQAQTAKPVQGAPHISVESNLPKGVAFIAASKSLMHAKGNPLYAAELAKQHYGDNPQIEQYIRAKAAVGAATTATHAALTTPGALASEFIGLLNNAHIVGQLQGFRTVPHGVKIPRLATGSAAYWLGESKPIPLTGNSVDDLDISRFKLAAIATMSRELLMLGNPSIDALLRDTLIEATAAEVDAAFILSTNAGTAGIKPAAITYGLTPVNSSGVGPQHVRADVKAALDKFAIANQGTDGAVWIMHSVTASALTFMRNAMGGPAFPGMSINGGTLLGLPALVSNSVPGNGTDGYDLVLVKASEIFRPEAPGIEIASSNEASLEMLDAALQQDGNDGTGASLVSLFQTDMTAMRVILFDGWYPRRTPCAVRIAGAKYDETVIETIAAVTVTP